MSRERGQAMTEFAVAAAVLGLLLLGSATLAGLQRVDRQVQLMAREAAFTAAWRGERSAAALHARHAMQPSLVDAYGAPLVARPDQVRLDGAHVAAPGQAGIAAEALLAPLRVAGGFLGAGFDLELGGFRTGTVSARTQASARLPAPFAALALELRGRYAILDDAWHAADPAHVQRRTAGLVPTSRLQEWAMVWRPLAVPLSLLEPSLRDYCPGIIEADRVPEDRLGAGRTPLPRGCP